MLRVIMCSLVCVSLAGCITNTQSIQNAQVASGGSTAPARQTRPAPVPAAIPAMTPTARLADARLISVAKTTASGASLMLASPQALARDCSPLGRVEAKVITQPEHGTVTIASGTAFSNYAPGDPPYACNARRSPATVISYRSAPDYVGPDVAAVQVFFPDGRAPEMLFRIDVR